MRSAWYGLLFIQIAFADVVKWLTKDQAYCWLGKCCWVQYTRKRALKRVLKVVFFHSSDIQPLLYIALNSLVTYPTQISPIHIQTSTGYHLEHKLFINHIFHGIFLSVGLIYVYLNFYHTQIYGDLKYCSRSCVSLTKIIPPISS